MYTVQNKEGYAEGKGKKVYANRQWRKEYAKGQERIEYAVRSGEESLLKAGEERLC